MSFAPFIKINHHGYSIMLGCKLISHEDTETFTLLFEVWLSYMSDSPLIGIITYKVKVMQKAIGIVFPMTRHRWYLWHVMKNVLKKLRALQNVMVLFFLLFSTIYDSLSLL